MKSLRHYLVAPLIALSSLGAITAGPSAFARGEAAHGGGHAQGHGHAAVHATAHAGHGGVARRGGVVGHRPPAPRHEVMGPRPSPRHAWIGGHWGWGGGRYYWAPGYWGLAPRLGAAWVPGHWIAVDGGWAWEPGHWV